MVAPALPAAWPAPRRALRHSDHRRSRVRWALPAVPRPAPPVPAHKRCREPLHRERSPASPLAASPTAQTPAAPSPRRRPALPTPPRPQTTHSSLPQCSSGSECTSRQAPQPLDRRARCVPRTASRQRLRRAPICSRHQAGSGEIWWTRVLGLAHEPPSSAVRTHGILCVPRYGGPNQRTRVDQWLGTRRAAHEHRNPGRVVHTIGITQ
jgi:hypothetical protein